MAKEVGGMGPANVMKHLKGIHFPLDQREMIEIVKKGPGANTDEVIEIIKKMPNQEYSSVAEIMREVGKVLRAEK